MIIVLLKLHLSYIIRKQLKTVNRPVEPGLQTLTSIYITSLLLTSNLKHDHTGSCNVAMLCCFVHAGKCTSLLGPVLERSTQGQGTSGPK